MNYYSKQLKPIARLSRSSIYNTAVKFNADGSHIITNWLSLDSESIPVIQKFLIAELKRANKREAKIKKGDIADE